MPVRPRRPGDLTGPADLTGTPGAIRRRAVAVAVAALRAGLAVAHPFGNIYALTSRADAATVRAVNRLKGRPVEQVGSITTTRPLIPDVWDWSALPAGLSRSAVLAMLDALLELGPFGFVGPAAAGVPHHLTYAVEGIRTAQVIVPGRRCPSNEFLAGSLAVTGSPLLHITSANRSRHLSGAAEEPAHYTAAGVRAEFGGDPRLHLLEHPDEDGAAAAYPRHQPMSTSILAFHRVVGAGRVGRRALLLGGTGPCTSTRCAGCSTRSVSMSSWVPERRAG